jgi:hypothetical protein
MFSSNATFTNSLYPYSNQASKLTSLRLNENISMTKSLNKDAIDFNVLIEEILLNDKVKSALVLH